MKFLEDDSILLRAVEPADADIMFSFESDSEQWRENGMAAPFSRHNLLHYAETYDADPIRAGQLRLVIQYKEPLVDGSTRPTAILGLVDLYDISPLNRTAFIGIYIHPDWRRMGAASRALALIEAYARQLLNLRVLAAKVSSENIPSQYLFAENGYEKAGELRDWLLSGPWSYPLLIFTKHL